MNHAPTWTEVILLITALSALYRWWAERRDKRSALQKTNDELTQSKTEAEKTVRTLKEAIEAKNMELAAKDRLIDRHERRIDHLETLVFSKSGIGAQP